jgi:hypothetical protein
VNEQRCSCGALLFRQEAERGKIEIVCHKCRKRQVVYLGGYQQRPNLTIVKAQGRG